MEIVKGGRRVCGSTIDDFCFYSGRDSEGTLSNSEKTQIVEDSVDRLDRTEWQRWFPGLGMARFVKDIVSRDNILLTEIHSPAYNAVNIAYNMATATIAGSMFFGYLLSQ